MIDFRGTELMPDARGEARVESKQGAIRVDATMSKMGPATQYGPEYLTYVMWAVTPEGRATNLGEVLVSGGGHSKLLATTELQSFGLIITAEPYFAVTQPSDVVVMENFVRKDTTGTIEEVDAKYELLRRGQYTLNVNPREIRAARLDSKTPLELYEARNAVQIASWAGAAQYAPDTFRKAQIGLQNAEGYLKGKGGSKKIGTVAREAVQMAEDARIISIKKLEEIALANERAASAAREADAQRATAEEARKRAQAESDQRLEAERRARAEAERSAAQLESERIRAQAQADAEKAARERDQIEQARQAALRDQQAATAEAEAARAAAKAEREKLEEARLQATQQQQAAQAEADRARAAAADAERLRHQAEADKEAMRAQLLQQLNLVLETRDSARGLIVNMSDVLFDTGLYTLRPGAREKLAKVAGIVITHPGLKLEVEGHTDSVGGDEYNQTLSENRANSVRMFLIQQGIDAKSITSRGFGKTRPVASNATAPGRQQNRRVELVVSGELIGGSQLESKTR